MGTPLTVFVCSTFSDLGNERKAVLDAIRRLQLQHDSMEFFGAHADQPIETCLAQVRRSNILVVIVGYRYGSLAPGLGISFSEAEYNEGYRLNKPCLVYTRDENIPILPKHMEHDPEKLVLLERWKTTLQERHTVALFQQSDDLAVQVAADLSRTINGLDETARAREEARRLPTTPILDELTELINGALEVGASEQVILSSLRRAVAEVVAETKQLGPTLFLSYAREDQDIVRQVADGLIAAGMTVWLDVTNLAPGVEWVREIERELDAADFIVFFISPNSVQSGWPQRELQIALHRQLSGEHGAVLLPVLLQHADVPPLLRQIQWLDMTDGDVDRAVQEMVGAIRRLNRQGMIPNVNETDAHVSKIPKKRIVEVLDEERGVVGEAAKRLGLTPKRLYELLKYHNIQPREFR